jgi:serine/threonine protein kinase
MEFFILKRLINNIRRYLGLNVPLTDRQSLQSRINKISFTSEGFIRKEAGEVFFRKGHHFDPCWLLKREIEFLRRLDGQHVPRVLDAGDCWVIMDYCGEELSFGNLPSNWREQIKLIADILNEVGIVHRDIKPGNLLVRGGKLFLIDFGWAVWKHEEPYLSPRELYGCGLFNSRIPYNQIYDNEEALFFLVSKYEK